MAALLVKVAELRMLGPEAENSREVRNEMELFVHVVCNPWARVGCLGNAVPYVADVLA